MKVVGRSLVLTAVLVDVGLWQSERAGHHALFDLLFGEQNAFTSLLLTELKKSTSIGARLSRSCTGPSATSDPNGTWTSVLSHADLQAFCMCGLHSLVGTHLCMCNRGPDSVVCSRAAKNVQAPVQINVKGTGAQVLLHVVLHMSTHMSKYMSVNVTLHVPRSDYADAQRLGSAHAVHVHIQRQGLC